MRLFEAWLAGNQGEQPRRQLNIREGDTITITGYWVTTADHEMLVATEAGKQGKIVQLRDSQGRPAW